MNQGIHHANASGKPGAFWHLMVAIALVVCLMLPAKAQPPKDLVNAEVGATMDLHKRPSLLTRLSYSVPIGIMRFEAGGIGLFGRDGGFGFDVLLARPAGAFEPLAGSRFLVWEQSMSVGFPLGIRWKVVEDVIELTLGITVAPTLHLTAEERNTVIFDTFIGVRF
jgi:hypothetical protein